MELWHQTNWYAIQSKPCREQAAAAQIRGLSLEVFLPLYKQQRPVWGVRKVVVRPLFPGYLFARFSPVPYLHMIHYARGVSRVIGCGETPSPIDEAIIEAIQGRVEEDGLVKLGRRMDRIRGGDRVFVKEGLLQGLEGIFEREATDRDRVLILLGSIQYQARVIIEKRHLEAVANIS